MSITGRLMNIIDGIVMLVPVDEKTMSMAQLFLMLNETNASEISIREFLSVLSDIEKFSTDPKVFIEFDGETFWVRKESSG